MAGLALFAEAAILVVYGKQWLPIVPVFRVLCFLGALQSIGTLGGSIFNSQGKTLLAFKIGMIIKPILIVGIVAGLLWKGLMGMVWGYTITSTIAFFFESYFVTKVVGKRLQDLFFSFWKEALSVAISIFAVLALRIAFFNMAEVKAAETILLIVVFALVYLGCCLYFRIYAVKFIKDRIYGRKEIPAHNAG
jgi:PST family polysaccharide transporter